MPDNFDFAILLNILFAITVVLLVLGSYGLSKRFDKRIRLLRVLRSMFITSFLLCVPYFIAIRSTSQEIAHVLFSISIFFYNGVIGYFFQFADVYSNKSTDRGNAPFRPRSYIVSAILIIDGISVLAGIFFKHVIFTTQVDIAGQSFFRYEAGPFHGVHYVISILAVIFGLGGLLYSSVKAPKSYKRRYYNVVLAVISVVAVNVVFTFLGAPIDLSGVILPIAIVVIYYYTIVFYPGQLLRESRAAVIDEMGDAILIFDFDGVYRSGNKRATQLFNTDGKNDARIVFDWVMRNNIDVLKAEERSFKALDLAGAPIIQLSVVPYFEEGSVNVIAGSYIRIHDRTEEVRENEERVYAATHDGLTGHLNRDAFLATAQEFLENLGSIDCYMVCTNIENFKLYNSLFGPEKGDELLKNIGEALDESIKSRILMGRMEADRFCVLMKREDFKPEEFQMAYAQALAKSENPNYSINAYIGVYAITELTENTTIMYNRTLMAAQSIKGNADEFVSFYDSSITDQIIDEQNKIDELRAALARDEFEFFIQPQVTPEGKVLGGEALVRWNHPERGIVSPYFFIGLMERHGMIGALDLAVWRKVCKKLSEWKKNKVTDQYISVNISTKDFYYMDIYETFVGLTEEYDIDRSKLKLEITESAIMQNEKDQIALIESLRDAGFTVEMDDFGSGYSSLNMLNKMPVDVLKLDMGFLQREADVERSKVILENIQHLAKDLHMVTIAEGVETKEQADFLTGIGCNILQGYLFSKPIPVSEYEEKFLR